MLNCVPTGIMGAIPILSDFIDIRKNMTKKDENNLNKESSVHKIEKEQELQHAEDINSSEEQQTNNQFDTLFIVWTPGKKHLINEFNQTVTKTLGCMHVEDKTETFSIQEATRMCLLEGGELNEESAKQTIDIYTSGQCTISYYFLIRNLKNNYAKEICKLQEELKDKHGFEIFKDYHLSSNWNTKQLDQSFLISGLELGRLITRLLENLKK